jgi:hypothetical protein
MLEIAALALSYARILVGTARFERATTAFRTRDAARLHHVPPKNKGAGLALMAGPAPRRLRSADLSRSYAILGVYGCTDRHQPQAVAELAGLVASV